MLDVWLPSRNITSHAPALPLNLLCPQQFQCFDKSIGGAHFLQQWCFKPYHGEMFVGPGLCTCSA